MKPHIDFNLPSRGDDFTGRTRELDELDQRLRTQRRVALIGIGGLGKSSLAREYLAQHADRYRIRAWISAASRLALETGLAELGQALFACGFSQNPLPPADWPGDRAEWTLDVLAKTPGWLLVLDNADEPDELDGLLPDATHGRLLITSRSLEVPCPALEVQAWDREEALAYLRQRTRLPLVADEEQAARDLLSEVETLPLAVEAIAAFVATHKTSMIDYHAAFMKERTRLFPKPATGGESGKADDPKADPRRSVHTVWALALEKVKKSHPASYEFLALSAYLSPDGVPEWLWKRGLEAGNRLLELDSVLAPLLHHALLRRGAGQTSVHRIIQSVLREDLETTSDNFFSAARAAALLERVLPDANDVSTWPDYQALLPSIHTLFAAATELETLSAAALWDQAAVYLWCQSHYAQAEMFFRRKLVIWEQNFGPNHFGVARSLTNLARSLQAQGKLGEAEPLYRRSLAIWEQNPDLCHREMVGSLNYLANLSRGQKKFEEAEAFYRRSLSILEQTPDLSHREVAGVLSNLGLLFKFQGKLGEAERLYRQSLSIWEKALGPNHPDVASSLNNLAVLLKAQGKLGEAEPLYQRSLSILEQTLGPNHPDVATSLNNLGPAEPDALAETDKQRNDPRFVRAVNRARAEGGAA